MSRTVDALKIKDAVWAEDQMFMDHRGVFWQFAQWQGTVFQQANFSKSTHGVVRGMHVQHVNPQGKMIACLNGELLDVIHDLRGSSPTYGVTDWKILKPGMSLYAPPGTAHGFQCLTKNCEIVYLCTSLYDKSSDTGFRWMDLKAPWERSNAVSSQKDANLPTLSDLVRRHEWMRLSPPALQKSQ